MDLQAQRSETRFLAYEIKNVAVNRKHHMPTDSSLRLLERRTLTYVQVSKSISIA
jgi:hypothetical protein